MSNCAVGGLNFVLPHNTNFGDINTGKVYSVYFQDFEDNLFDCFESSVQDSNQIIQQEKVQAPKIGLGRILTHRFTKEQINAINECRELPQNAKFKGNNKISITLNLFDITKGTHKLPEGYELKNDILGYTHVVREGTKSLFIR